MQVDLNQRQSQNFNVKKSARLQYATKQTWPLTTSIIFQTWRVAKSHNCYHLSN